MDIPTGAYLIIPMDGVGRKGWKTHGDIAKLMTYNRQKKFTTCNNSISFDKNVMQAKRECLCHLQYGAKI